MDTQPEPYLGDDDLNPSDSRAFELNLFAKLSFWIYGGLIGPLFGVYTVARYLGGEHFDALVIGITGSILLLITVIGTKHHFDSLLHCILGVVLVMEMTLTLTHLDDNYFGFVWFYTIPVAAGVLGNQFHVLVWTPLALACMASIAVLAPPDHPVFRDATALTSGIGVLVVLGVSALAMLWAKRARDRSLTTLMATRRRQREALEATAAALQMADHTRRRYVASMSHELRTPLTAVMLAADQLLDSDNVDERDHMASVIRRSCATLLGIVADSFDVARIETGEISLNERPMSILDLCGDTLDLLSNRAHSNERCLILDLPSDSPLMRLGDWIRIQQILINLITATLRNSSNGPIRVRVGGDSTTLQLCIDYRVFSGFGDEIHQFLERPHATDPLAIGSSTIPGAGFGLHIALELAAAMGGTIRGERQQFHSLVIDIPAVSLSPQTVADELTPTWSKQRRVQLADHDPWALAAAEQWLQHWGVTTSDSALQIDLEAPNRYGAPIRSVPALRHAVLAAIPIQHHHDPSRTDPGSSQTTVANHQPSNAPTCLVVDDDELVVELVCTVLEKAGARTLRAFDGRLGLEMLKQNPVDLLFTDLAMPEMSGVEMLTALRTSEIANRAIPVCVISGTLLNHAAVIELGADDFLLKPLLPDDIRRVLTEQLPTFDLYDQLQD